MKAIDAIKELRKEDKRKFTQTVDLIFNFQKYDPRKQGLNTFVQVPHPAEKRICAFLSAKSKIVDTIIKEDFDKYKDNKVIKQLAAKYDSFIAVAPMMAPVATKFGRVLGPMGKMPSPQAGIIPQDTDEAIAKEVEKMRKVIRVRTKENSLKLTVGKEDMSDEDLAENIEAVVKAVANLLPTKKDNIKNVLVKFTMTKPLEINK